MREIKVVRFIDIKDELVNNIRRNMLIPIIGSGFTRGCKSYKGNVPSGLDYKKYMIHTTSELLSLSPEEKEKLNSDNFSAISDIYHQVVPAKEQRDYLRNNFSKVILEQNKREFLSLNWPYLYTLNIDDGIENNSIFNHVVYANRKVNESVFDTDTCVIKLHGDVSEILTYCDSDSEVFSQTQYLRSLQKNVFLLNKLRHDAIYQNLVFVGCSLDDEVDLLAYASSDIDNENVTAKYICLAHEPTILEKLKYQKYGITHCIVFDSYNCIYDELYSAGIEANKISIDDLSYHIRSNYTNLSTKFEDNRPYLLYGKSLLDHNRTLTIPYFFISRNITTKIISNLEHVALQILVGSRCSGKTYVLVDIARRVKNRDIYFFETKDRISDGAFDILLNKSNCVVLADSAVLSSDQIERIINELEHLKASKISFVIAANKNDRDLNGLLKLYELRNMVDFSQIRQIEIHNRFNSNELSRINPLLTVITAGIYSANKTIVDNIIDISEKLTEKNKYYNTSPRMRSISEIASLIALSTERKIYSERAIELNLSDELLLQRKTTEPLIDSESTWSFEKSFGDNSPVKYVLNAEYWLSRKLEIFARDIKNHDIIANAYRLIITNILLQEGHPDLFYTSKYSSYKEYIRFDNINRIFCASNSFGKVGLSLIRTVYEKLNDLLSVDPNYMHQRAKCYIKSSYYADNKNSKIDYLDKAYRDANVALQVFSARYDESHSEKLLISIDHIIYTQALILCHRCNINDYSSVPHNSEAICILYHAMGSPYNSYDFAKTDSFNYNNVIMKTVQTFIADKELISPEYHQILEKLFFIMTN